METVYHQTNALIQQTQQKFSILEKNKVGQPEVEQEIQENINTINGNCEKLDILVLKVPVVQRQHAKMRCNQLKYDCKHLQAALSSVQQKRQKQEQLILEREQLLGTRFRANSDTTIDLDYAVQQHGTMQRVHSGVDEMLHTGTNALESLRSQRMTLKGARKRIVDMANTLGLSTHVIKLIERRAGQDKYILIIGMILTLLIILLIIIYLT